MHVNAYSTHVQNTCMYYICTHTFKKTGIIIHVRISISPICSYKSLREVPKHTEVKFKVCFFVKCRSYEKCNRPWYCNMLCKSIDHGCVITHH